MYPSGKPALYVVAPELSNRLCGAFRPGHFEGVLTVVAKLFHQVAPDVAVFGRKDFQQLVLIRRMVSELDFPLDVLEGAIVREPDGLAMSSRNVYLEKDARSQATLLSAALGEAQRAFAKGERVPAKLIAAARAALAKGVLVRPQYVELVDAESLEAVDVARAGNVLALAAHVGGTRLIDNGELSVDS
jgi:pantoate--beta-alanine ligase